MIIKNSNISQNDFLRELMHNNTIKKLILTNCPYITEIPELKYLTDITCENCPQLKRIYVRNVETLKIIRCENLQQIKPSFDKVKKLTIKDSRLKSFYGLGSIEFFLCTGCENLEKIDAMGLKNLNCSKCPKLKEIKNTRTLESLYCENCPSLKKVSLMPKLKILRANKSILERFSQKLSSAEKNAELYHEWVLERKRLLKLINSSKIPIEIFEKVGHLLN